MADPGELQGERAGKQSWIHRVQGYGQQELQAGIGHMRSHTEAGRGEHRRSFGVHHGNGFPVPDEKVRQNERHHG
eukprot:4140580-Heterocapsa_arctica.AAC.1